MYYRDRKDAGQRLASALGEWAGANETLLLALPRGGVVVAYEVARALDLPLDIVCPRKIGAPLQPELALGAITETGEGIFSLDLIRELGVSEAFIQEAVEKETKEAASRLSRYRPQSEPRQLEGKRVILVDDGIATGSTMRAAIATVKAEKAREVIVAVPVAPLETVARIDAEVDHMICLHTPATFYAVGQFYDQFEPTSDEEVTRLLQVLVQPLS